MNPIGESTSANNPSKKNVVWEFLRESGITPNLLTVIQAPAAVLATLAGVSADSAIGVVIATTTLGVIKCLDFVDGTYARYLANNHNVWGPNYQGEILDPYIDKFTVYVPNVIMSVSALTQGEISLGVNILISSAFVGWNDIKSTLKRGMPDLEIVGETMRVPYRFRKVDGGSTKDGANIYGKIKTVLQGIGQGAFLLSPAFLTNIPQLQLVGTFSFVSAFALSILSLRKKSKTG